MLSTVAIHDSFNNFIFFRLIIHSMNVSTFDLNHAKVLHFLLAEAHVGRAAVRLGITAAAASNALRRLREEFGDPLLAKKGRGLIRTRVGEELLSASWDVMRSAQLLLSVARPFDASSYSGPLQVAMSDHVATLLIRRLHDLAAERAPCATLVVSAIPLSVSHWLEETGGVLIGPAGLFGATHVGDSLVTSSFYEDRYVCLMRRGHPIERRALTVKLFAGQSHVVVTPRGKSPRSDVDEGLERLGITRRVTRIVPSFSMALAIIEQSDLITTMPEKCARQISLSGLVIKPLPVTVAPLQMKMVMHPAHAHDARTEFITRLLNEALPRPTKSGK